MKSSMDLGEAVMQRSEHAAHDQLEGALISRPTASALSVVLEQMLGARVRIQLDSQTSIRGQLLAVIDDQSNQWILMGNDHNSTECEYTPLINMSLAQRIDFLPDSDKRQPVPTLISNIQDQRIKLKK